MKAPKKAQKPVLVEHQPFPLDQFKITPVEIDCVRKNLPAVLQMVHRFTMALDGLTGILPDYKSIFYLYYGIGSAPRCYTAKSIGEKMD